MTFGEKKNDIQLESVWISIGSPFRHLRKLWGSFPLFPPSGLFTPSPVEAVAAATSVHAFIH